MSIAGTHRRRSTRMGAALLWPLLLAGQNLDGVIDLHAHSDPDSMPRSIDGLAAARLARERGMRGILLKNHYESTAGLAYLARQQAPGLLVFGGIALNRSVGGINPAAVEQMTRVKGGYGRVVWMPTFDAENQVRFNKQDRPFVAISRNGRLLAEVEEVLRLIAERRLTLATGHSSPAENLLLIRAARRAGVERVLVTHPMHEPVRMTVAQMQEAARAGAYLEFPYLTVIGDPPPVLLGDCVAAIRAIGVDRAVLSSDLGQAGNPPHPDGLARFFQLLREKGFTEAEIAAMAKTNPARVLGVE